MPVLPSGSDITLTCGLLNYIFDNPDPYVFEIIDYNVPLQIRVKTDDETKASYDEN